MVSFIIYSSLNYALAIMKKDVNQPFSKRNYD